MRLAWWTCLVTGLALSRPAIAADDDLDVVKRALARKVSVAEAHSSARAMACRFKVRVVDKPTGREKVSISLPLGLVEVLGDWPLDHCHGWGRAHRHARPTLAEALAALRSGREIVQVDDQDTSVRVWIE